jgi:hypothetical protein
MLTVDQERINFNKPMRVKPGKAKGRCPDCMKKYTLDLQVRGNQGRVISGVCYGACTNSKCKTKPKVRLSYEVKL